MNTNWRFFILCFFVSLLILGLILLISSPQASSPLIILPTSTSSPVIVYISGAINNPGVYTLPAGSRINDLIITSGGFSDNADQIHINLASVLNDGQQIYVLACDEVIDTSLASVVVTQSSSPLPLIDLNSASQEELESIPGIGSIRALAIIDYRNQHGNFNNLEQLLNISGIGDTIFQQIRPFLYISYTP